MGLLSILPASFSTVETWLTRIFMVFGLMIIGPWAILVVYDLILYVFRAVAYEIPVVGGRARGKTRPRAPSLTERPNGHRRRFSLARPKEDTGSSTGADTPEARSRQSKGENYNGSVR
ncbi:hypothetical protein OPT61_g5551 [Boeremia exigua]|uniref:Uncharacterized protein n=1 Tax=Boeremia exigua TaxID=749465 RepID=A0ACC2I9V0_9PLEO|nr:hypothetical protein OPT61_g5551 [Boeremia exigua]